MTPFQREVLDAVSDQVNTNEKIATKIHPRRGGSYQGCLTNVIKAVGVLIAEGKVRKSMAGMILRTQPTPPATLFDRPDRRGCRALPATPNRRCPGSPRSDCFPSSDRRCAMTSSRWSDAKASVLTSTDIVELIGHTVALKRQGKDYVGLCPFHEEKTPSFHVSPAKKFFHCFGCKANGNAIDFVMKRDRLDFAAAVRSLGRGAAWMAKPMPPAPPQAPAPEPPDNRRRLESITAWCARDVNATRLQKFADRLGVTTASLDRLGIGWSAIRFCVKCDGQSAAWTFPMRDAIGVRGIRLRYADCGHKSAVKDGHDGLFIPRALGMHGDGPDARIDRLFICEGPTDTAALLDLGFPAVGRPSCLGGVPIIVDFIRTWMPAGVGELVIVADGDGPGQKGADLLASKARLHCQQVKVITPAGVKDVREWKSRGATAADVEQLVRETSPRKLRLTLNGVSSNEH